MARKPRIYSLSENGYYHVIARGNNQKSIYRETQDYLFWKSLLKKCKQKFNFKIIAYALMPNHYHLLIKTGNNLPKIMSSFNTRYAMYFNYKYNLKGHLFDGRYRSSLVADDPYLITLIRYIHSNPVRANLVEDALSYEFSSLKDYQNNSGLTDITAIEDLIDTSAMGTVPLTILR